MLAQARASGPLTWVRVRGKLAGRYSLTFIIADQHPECQVTGIDLSPGQPTL
jgi:hypothetical protein